MAAEETSTEVLELVFKWTLWMGVGFVGSGFFITLVLT